MTRPRHALALFTAFALLAACGDPDTADTSGTLAPPPPEAVEAVAAEAIADAGSHTFATTEVALFDAPWAMAFLPDGRLLVTEMGGALKLHDLAASTTGTIRGVPGVVHVAQGGLGDVVLHPRFDSNRLVYISYVESGDDGLLGAAVARARLVLDDSGGGALEGVETIWRQEPKKSGDGHFGFSGNGALEAERFDMKRRIREVEQGPDGAIWLLEDGTREGKGRLLKLTPEAA
jgi:glucose/arabinose dehydrogenase